MKKLIALAATILLLSAVSFGTNIAPACTDGSPSQMEGSTGCSVGDLTFYDLSIALTGDPSITPLDSGMPQQGAVVAPYGIEITGSYMTGTASWDVSGAAGGIVFAQTASIDPFDNSINGALIGSCVSLNITTGPPNFFRTNSGSICSTYPDPDEITSITALANGPSDSFEIAYDPPNNTAAPEPATIWLLPSGLLCIGVAEVLKRRRHEA